MRYHRAVQALLILLVAVVFLHGIDNYPLTERSEARYTGVAWEMMRSGDYVTPQYNGIKHFHKPPLFYWSVALGMKLFGSSELTARLPTTLAAFGVLLLTLWFGGRVALEKDRAWVGWLAAAMLAGSPFFWEMGRIGVTDMLVSFFVIVSLAAAWSTFHQGPSKGAFFVFWLSMGLDFLTKGPVGPLIVAMVIVPYAWRRKQSLRSLRPWPGLALAIAIGLPWYVLVAVRNPGLLSYFLIFQTVDRVVTNVHHRAGPLWFYLPVILGGFLPWTTLLPESARSSFREAREARNDNPNPDLFLLLWAAVPVLFFSLISSKLPPYVLPCFPALALLVARAFSRLSWASLWGPPLTLLVAGVTCLNHAHLIRAARLARFSPDLDRAAVWLLLASVVALGLAFGKKRSWLAGWSVIAMLGLQFLAGIAFGKLDYLTAKPLVDAVKAQSAGEPFEVAMYGRYLFGLPFYVGGRVVQVESPREIQFQNDDSYKAFYYTNLRDYLEVFRRDDQDRYLIVDRRDLPPIQAYLPEPVIYSDEKLLVFFHGKGSVYRNISLPPATPPGQGAGENAEE